MIAPEKCDKVEQRQPVTFKLSRCPANRKPRCPSIPSNLLAFSIESPPQVDELFPVNSLDEERPARDLESNL